jgi:hypothetical protein
MYNGAEEVDQMKNNINAARYWLAAQVIGLLAVTPLQQACKASQPKVREAGVAGSFYPADPAALNAIMDGMLAGAAADQGSDSSCCCAARRLSVLRPRGGLHVRSFEGA